MDVIGIDSLGTLGLVNQERGIPRDDSSFVPSKYVYLLLVLARASESAALLLW